MLHGTPKQKKLGDDDGCFVSALDSVRRYGGVIEHPEASHAWRYYGLNKPPKSGGWIEAGDGGYTCCVEQGHYGHLARKATWLYVNGIDRLPELIWGKSSAKIRLDDGFHSAEERKRAIRTGAYQRLSHKQRLATPVQFRDLLINLVRGNNG